MTFSHWLLVTGPISLLRHFLACDDFSSEESCKYHEHNIWNPMLASLCHFEVGVVVEALLDEVDMGRIALVCHFSGGCIVRYDILLTCGE